MNERKNCEVGTVKATLGAIARRGLLSTTLIGGVAAPALAAADDHDTLDVSDLQRVDDGSLEDLRGGFNVAGFDVSFGVKVTTSVNGQELLQTSFNVDQPGRMDNLVTNPLPQQQASVGNGSTVGLGNGTVLTFHSGSMVPVGSNAAGGAQQSTTENSASAADTSGSGNPGWTVSQSADGTSWTVSSEDLATTITQQIGNGVSTNIVNSADDISVEHTTELSLHLDNFPEMQAQAATSQAISNLMLDMTVQAAGTN